MCSTVGLSSCAAGHRTCYLHLKSTLTDCFLQREGRTSCRLREDQQRRTRRQPWWLPNASSDTAAHLLSQPSVFGCQPREVRTTVLGGPGCPRRPPNTRYLERTTSGRQREQCANIPEQPQDTCAPFYAACMCFENRLKTSISLCYGAMPPPATSSPLRTARDQLPIVYGTLTEAGRASDDGRRPAERLRSCTGRTSGHLCVW